MTEEERFWAKVHKTDGCWLWTAAKVTHGYGRFGVRRVMTAAHRYSWQLHNGPIPDGMYVLHTCDVPACVNPDHLFIGTQQDNIDDMIAKGRDNNSGYPGRIGVKGEKHGRAILTESAVLDIRSSNKARKELAQGYGVTIRTIGDVLTRKSWTHI